MNHKLFKHVASSGCIAAIMAVIVFCGYMPRAQAQDYIINDGVQELVSSSASPFDVIGGLLVNGSGELEISGAGVVNSSAGRIGDTPHSSSTPSSVIVDGSGSVWTMKNANSPPNPYPDYDLSVGYADDGTLTIRNGGLVSNYNGRIGFSSNVEGSVTVTGSLSTWTNERNVYAGFRGTGKLFIEDGGTVNSAEGVIGYQVGGVGEVTVTGTGSTWNNTGGVYVGDQAGSQGTLTISAGGQVTNLYGYIGVNAADLTLGRPTSSGVVTVTGQDSLWKTTLNIFVGHSGEGTLTISDSGTVTSVNGFIGNNSEGIGKVTVEDGALWQNDASFNVGFSGDGTLDIITGGQVTNVNGFIASESNSSGKVTVDGVNSLWENTGNLIVGRFGDGTLDISDQGLVTNVDGFIAFDAGSSGTVTVDGANSTWANANELSVGVSGDGKLGIINDGLVTSVNGYIGVASGGIGEVTVDNSTWANTGDLNVGVDGDGKLNINNNGQVSSVNGSIGVASGGIGEVTVDNSTWTNTGALNVGFAGDGKLGIINDGLVIATGGVLIANDPASNSSLEVTTGGTLETSALAAGSGTPSATFDDGTLRALAANPGFISDFSIGELVIDAGGLTIDSNGYDIGTDSSAFSGMGGLTKTGIGVLTMGGANTYSGDTTVATGTLKAGLADVFSPASAFTINTGATLDLDGYDQSVAGLINSGLVNMGSTTSAKTVGTILTVNGNYESNGGSLYMRTMLGDDSSPTDKLVVDSVTTGSGGATRVYITNANGAGSYTYVDGIQIVQVAATSSNDAFRLGAPVTAGIYEYVLGQSSNQSWYLTNQQPIIVAPIDPPTESPKFLNPNIGSYLGNQYAAATMFRQSIFDRLENISSPGQTVWLRVNYGDLKTDLLDGRQHADITTTLAQIGVDLIRHNQWVAGVFGGYGHSKTENKSNQTGTKADGKVDGGHIGLYGSWLPEENHGFYADVWGYYAWFENKLSGQAQSRTTKYDSTGYAFSGEIGYQIPISRQDNGNTWLLTPQAQVTYVNLNADNFTDSHGTRFTNNEGSGFQSRLGARLHGQRDPCWNGVLPFVELNWLHNTVDNGIRLDGTEVSTDIGKNVGEIKVGLQGTATEGLSVWGHVGAQQGSDGYERYEAQLGLAMRW